MIWPTEKDIPEREYLEQVSNRTLVARPMHNGIDTRGELIGKLRAALNAAEGGHDEVLIDWGALDVMWNFEDGEFSVTTSVSS